ncbi:MAG: GTP cyclohydrolase I [Candidatus Dormibacteraceae bacterium]
MTNYLHLEADGGRDETELQLHPRHISEADWSRYKSYVAEIFESLGMEMGSPGTLQTPERFLRALLDATAGYEGDPKLVTLFPDERLGESSCGTHQLVVEGPITFYSLCEHHALPFFGHAHVGYVPGEKLIGISKLTRLVRLYAMRFSLQERIGEEVANGLAEILEARGVAVHLEATHLCTQMRGVKDTETRTQTTTWRGAFGADSGLRDQFLLLMRNGV